VEDGEAMSNEKRTIQVEGQQLTIDQTTTVQELKEAVGAADDDIATYTEDGEIAALGNRDNVHRNVPEGANISFQPGKGTVFGH